MLKTATDLMLHLSWKALPELVLVHVMGLEPQPVQEAVQELVLA